MRGAARRDTSGTNHRRRDLSSNEVIETGIVANLSPDRNRLLVGECDDRSLSTPMLDLMAALAIRQARDKGLYRD
jgi:hypothetical protein